MAPLPPRLGHAVKRNLLDPQPLIARTSKRARPWVRRHDKSAELNHVAPRPEDMEVELALVRAWHKRVKGYQGS
jgi:hypothetical protein